MNAPANKDRDAYLELLAAETLGDLSHEEEQRLQRLAAQFPDIEADEFDRIAAAIELALTPMALGDMPASLRQAVEQDAPDYVNLPDAPTVPVSPAARSARNLRESFAWFAATAALLLAMLGWINRPPTAVEVALSPEEARQAIVDTAGSITVTWGPGKHPFAQEVSGDVVWHNGSQKGFMRFVNMPVNDPTREQYQLWIIDPKRDAEPIDGGVFDVSDSGEVIVAIDPKLDVIDPQAFAITIEQPGGVVVSTQERLPLLAAVSST